MKIYQSRLFEKRIQKLNKAEKLKLDSEINQIIDNPSIGTEKKGDLRGILVYKFTLLSQLYLLAYRFSSDSLELIMIGPHKNYYRDLKTHLKSR